MLWYERIVCYDIMWYVDEVRIGGGDDSGSDEPTLAADEVRILCYDMRERYYYDMR
jgi:hypothetical protein